jgi:hypothetical protein
MNVAANGTDGHGPDPDMRRAATIRNVAMALLGAAVLVLVPAYGGPFADLIGAYAGNVAVSFALYFAALNASARFRWPRLLAASATLLAVELFEATDGFGVMANTFDLLDFVANAAGVGLAFVVDIATTPFLARNHARPSDGHGSAPT